MAVIKIATKPGLARNTSPIQYLTENGFSIIRRCEINGRVTDTPVESHFLVRSETGWEHEVIVHFDDDVITQIQKQRPVPLSRSSVFWHVCAERCLAAYLWEKNDYPLDGKLIVTRLSVDELLLAKYWRDSPKITGEGYKTRTLCA